MALIKRLFGLLHKDPKVFVTARAVISAAVVQEIAFLNLHTSRNESGLRQTGFATGKLLAKRVTVLAFGKVALSGF